MKLESSNFKIYLGGLYLALLFIAIYFLFSTFDIKDFTSYEFIKENRDYIEYPLRGYYLHFEGSKYLKGASPIHHLEFIGKAERHLELKDRFFLGSSFKSKWSSDGYQPYFAQKGFGFDDYVRGYEYYVIDGQDFWLSKTVIKYSLIQKTNFDIPYVKMKQFNKAHYSLYLGLFSDMGYVIDKQTNQENSLSNSFLWGNGISLDYVTYYDKLLRIKEISKYFPFFLRSNISSFFQSKLPLGLKGKKTLEFFGTDLNTTYPNIAEFYSSKDLKKIFHSYKESSKVESVNPWNKKYINDLIANATFEDFTSYLKGDLLVKVDRASMANSLEVRSPFLDKSIIEFAFLEVPSALKATVSSRKILLKNLACKILPHEFNHQRKQGFSIPINKLLSDPIWSDFFHQKVVDSDPNIFNKKNIFKIIKSFGGYRNNGERIAALIFFMSWAERYNANF